MTETLANRRIFRSKLDTIRTTYGFEDVSLAPGTDTIDPDDVVLSQSFCGIDLGIPVLAAAMDAVADVRLSGELARLGGLAILNLEGVQTRYDDPTEVLERIAVRARRRHGRRARRGLRPADPRGADRAPDRRAACRRARRRRSRRPRASRAASGRSAPSTARTCSSSSRRSRRPATSRPATSRWRSRTSRGSCRSRSRSATRPTPQAAYLLMEQGAAAIFVGVGPGGRVHDPRGARHRDPAGHRDRRRRRGARPVPRGDRPLRARGRRRRHEARRRPRQGVRRGRRRRDARLAARARGRGAGARHELGHGGAVAGAPARDADQGRHGRAAGADPAAARRT